MADHYNDTDLFKDGMIEFAKDNIDKSIELFTRAIDLNAESRLAYTARGSAYMKMGRDDDALKDFDKAIEIDPDSSRAYHLRGLLREKRGQNDSALSDFNKAIDLNPEYGAAFYSRATLLTKLGREEEAVQDMQMVTHLTNKNIETFANENNLWRSQHLRMEAMEVASATDR